MSATITTKLITKDGSIDVDASCQEFADSLTKFVAEHEVEQSALGDAVSAVFDKYKGEPVTLTALAAMALGVLNAAPTNYAQLESRVKQYVRDNAGEGGTLSISKGKNGGVRRLADQPTPAAK
jgi:hypothetical protein